MSADAFKRLLILSTGAAYLASVPWAYRDAERRGRSGPLVALGVGLVSWPFGLLAWLFGRPARRSG
ncbi:hypothetical protein RQM47_11715 [Rubrivirga sp. S365]|uniref:hypothetical protein n=1 Tax=Rubrivirga sp. S365 TaxID=3076080 RepID=UPI0028C945AA|nr:hypothetical protein [Rubrivirga sp. S365]MDT7857308.1 hypothetical protein [Rubrivirga sp. S365]